MDGDKEKTHVPTVVLPNVFEASFQEDEADDEQSAQATNEKGVMPSPAARVKSSEEIPQSTESLSEEDLMDESEISYEEGVEDGIEKASDSLLQIPTDAVVTKREDTRSRLAIIFTALTFVIFILGMLLATLDGILRDVSIVDNLEKVIPLVSGVFLGTLGFVLGYYFRKEDEEK